MIGVPLRPYQAEPLVAILHSVLHHLGLTFTVMMSRQAGKNELSAQIEAYLLTLFHRRGGSIVKAAPTFKPQIVNSMLRLQGILEASDLTAGRWAPQWGYTIRVGKARIFFFSAGPDSQIVGATASLLLEVDEAQDVDEDKYLKDLRPMGASTNVTTVLYGTAWTADTLLERQRRENLRLEAIDGIRRDFTYPWNQVALANPAYGQYVQAEIDRLGEQHPLVRTQYLLDVIDGAGKFLSEDQVAQLHGSHGRLSAPQRGEIYVAGIDIAGEDEEAEDAALRSLKPRKDSTAVTIARVTWEALATGAKEPSLQVVQIYWWTGRKHRDVLTQLLDLLKNVWRCRAVVVDATGMGSGVASLMVGALGVDRCFPFTFTAVSKSALGYQFLGSVNGGRYKVYGDPTPEADEFWVECRLAKTTMFSNQRMQWYVDQSAGHDDLLSSAALAVEAAQHAESRAAVGRVAATPQSDKA